MKTTTKTTALASITLASALALSACSGGADPNVSQSPSSTPTVPSPTIPAQKIAPTSEKQSLESAQAAYKEYLQVYTQVSAAGGVDESPLRPLGIGMTNGGRASQFFRGLVATGSRTAGELNFKFLNGKVSTVNGADGTTVPLGQVDMQVCLDQTNFKTLGPDGTDSGKYGPQQMLYSVQAIWVSPRWTIIKDWITDDKVTACDAS